MKKKIHAIIFLLLMMWMLNEISGCKKEDFESKLTLKQLYVIYKNGEIDECRFNGHIVFLAALNAYDAGITIYDEDGNAIGVCNFPWGKVDSICWQLTDCEVIYLVKDNIWKLPAVDNYGLAN
jgi:hypothetical protein